VLERNVRFREGEIDLVCREGDVVVFVEVKCRRASWGEGPGDAVSWDKRRRLIRLAQHYLRARRLETTRVALRETLSAGSLEAYRALAESLAAEFDPLDVAAAALKHAEPPAAPEEDIPAIPAAHERRPRPERPRTAKGRPRATDMGRIFIGAGRALRITPADIALVMVHLEGKHAIT